jgi:antitoxin ParD1/3/4
MRTNIEIDDELMAQALKAGPYKTKKEAVEAGLKLLARQAAYREILKWRGKLKWEGDESIDWTKPAGLERSSEPVRVAREPASPGRSATATAGKRRARR